MRKRPGLRGFALMTSILLTGAGSGLAESGPFENFFHKLKQAFSEPQHKERSRGSKREQKGATATPTATTTPIAAATPGASGPPTERNTRTESRADSKKGDDLRYGTPVQDPYTGKVFLTP